MMKNIALGGLGIAVVLLAGLLTTACTDATSTKEDLALQVIDKDKAIVLEVSGMT